MPIETSDRHQSIVVWYYQDIDRTGEPTVSATPLYLKCRWRDELITLSTLNDKESIATLVVDRDIPELSVVWKGSKTQLPDDLDNLTDLYQVISKKSSPDIKNQEVRRKIYLKRFANTFPTTV